MRNDDSINRRLGTAKLRALAFQENIIFYLHPDVMEIRILLRGWLLMVVIRYSHEFGSPTWHSMAGMERVPLLRCGYPLYYVYLLMGNMAYVQEGHLSKRTHTQ